MRLILIGASGFIGSHVTRLLVKGGHDVIVFHRGKAPPAPGAREIVGDRRELTAHRAEFRALAPDVVVDFILSSGVQARGVMDLLRGFTKRVVAVSSCDVYRACGVLHGTEDGPLQPLPLTESSDLRSNPETYGREALRRAREAYPWVDDDYDKISVELEIRRYPDLPGTVLRLPMVYGPGDPLRRFKSLLTRMAADPNVLILEEKLAAWRSPRGYVENVAAAIALAATSEIASGQVYNVAEPDSCSVLDWATQIAEAIGWPGRLETLPFDRAPADARMAGNFDQHWVVDSSRIRHELGYRESVTRPDALQRTIAWERSSAAP